MSHSVACYEVGSFCKLHRRISPKIIWPLPQAQHVMPKSCKGVSGWVLIGVVSRNKHACKETSYLQFVKGLVGVRVLQLLELEKLKRSPRHFQLPSPPASVYLRIVIFRWRHIVVACTYVVLLGRRSDKHAVLPACAKSEWTRASSRSCPVDVSSYRDCYYKFPIVTHATAVPFILSYVRWSRTVELPTVVLVLGC